MSGGGHRIRHGPVGDGAFRLHHHAHGVFVTVKKCLVHDRRGLRVPLTGVLVHVRLRVPVVGRRTSEPPVRTGAPVPQHGA